uniref:Uncharacterized protein n=1 Tax=Populus alba TaxID=43335 RepID=A0A4U5PKE1_POPAL|nr:hypothetical protein D5086_0000213550 [Populus alba]
MALHRVASTPQHEDFDKPGPLMQGQVHDLEGKVGLPREGERREYKGKHEIFHSKKGRRGKGAYGGANVVHRPKHGGRSGAVLSAKASSFVTATMLCVSLAFILVFPSLSL